MKLIRILEVSEQEFYDYFEQDLITNMEQWMHQKISAKDIRKGLSYCKQDEKSNAQTVVTVMGYERGSYYSLRIQTMVDSIELTYHTKPDEKGIRIIFEQYIESFEKMKHKKLMRMFSEGVYFGRMSDTLYDMQAKIIKLREQQEQS